MNYFARVNKLQGQQQLPRYHEDQTLAERECVARVILQALKFAILKLENTF